VKPMLSNYSIYDESKIMIWAKNKLETPCCHGNREHIFWLLAIYRAAEKVKYDFLSSV
jgi:hypothetical protein